MECPMEPDVAVRHLCEWNAFLVTSATIDAVGWFDENFYPAYEEDKDFAYRCQLAGLRRIPIAGAGADHTGSATIRSDAAYARLNETTHHQWNAAHYRQKWGGGPGHEQFKHPFNNPAHDHRWWPDPGDSIAARDWDAGRRSEKQPAMTLDDLYHRAASTPSDINELVPILYKLGATVDHITEFGSGRGNSTSAFLFAKPRTLISYDMVRHDWVAGHEATAARAGIDFRFVNQDVRNLKEIEPTDLLFIDTWHVREQLEIELKHAAMVRRFIVLHDTETFGVRGETAGHEGQWQPVPGMRGYGRRWRGF
jgi:hypothetical protein